MGTKALVDITGSNGIKFEIGNDGYLSGAGLLLADAINECGWKGKAIFDYVKERVRYIYTYPMFASDVSSNGSDFKYEIDSLSKTIRVVHKGSTILCFVGPKGFEDYNRMVLEVAVTDEIFQKYLDLLHFKLDGGPETWLDPLPDIVTNKEAFMKAHEAAMRLPTSTDRYNSMRSFSLALKVFGIPSKFTNKDLPDWVTNRLLEA